MELYYQNRLDQDREEQVCVIRVEDYPQSSPMEMLADVLHVGKSALPDAQTDMVATRSPHRRHQLQKQHDVLRLKFRVLCLIASLLEAGENGIPACLT